MSSPRRILIVHPDEQRRRELRDLLTGEEVIEAASRQEAAQYLSWPPTHVVSHHQEFGRLLKDLERHVPGATRAVLCPDDEEQRQALVDVATRGYEFVTLDAPQGLWALLHVRASRRHAPVTPLTAEFRVGEERFTAAVDELADEGLGLLLDAHLAVERLPPGTRLLAAVVRRGERPIIQGRVWVVRAVRAAGPGSSARLGVSFEAPAVDDRPTERITDAVKVRALLRRAARRGRHFDVHPLDTRAARRFLEANADRAGERFTLSRPTSHHAFTAGQVVRLSFEFGGVQFEGVTAVQAADAGAVVVNRPDALSRRHRRASLRAAVEDGLEATITFRSPLGGSEGPRRLLDLHPAGASFAFSSDECFPAGLELEDVVIDVKGRQALGYATVTRTAPNASGSDGVDRQRCGVVLHGFSPGDQQVVRDGLIEVLAPGVSDGGALPFDELWQLFCAENNRFLDYPADDPAKVEVLREAHHTLGNGAHGVSKSFVFRGPERELVGHVSGLRIYSGTWLAQHLLVRSGYHRQLQVSQALVNLAFDYGEALGDVEYLRGLWHTMNRWSSRVFGTVTSRVLRAGLSCLSTFWRMRLPVARLVEGPALRAHAGSDSDIADFLAFVRRSRDPVWLRANDLTEQEFRLATVGKRYLNLGLQRQRSLGVVVGSEGTRGWVLVESCSPGLFWQELFNCFQVHLSDPGAPDAGEVRGALVAFAVRAQVARGYGVPGCLASREDVADLEQLGFENIGQLFQYDAHRTLARDIATQVVAVFEKTSRREDSP
ncbi:MAG: hypothetical protein JNJ54_32305 [Myxococcaceae bacterium]|nr:hypothetical protein [Myxococcaceae bacterium]